MLNNLRILNTWTDYFGDPQGSELGLLTALYSIGSIASLPITPYIADHFGRRMPIIMGCIIMVVGAGVQGGAHNLSSELIRLSSSNSWDEILTSCEHSVHGWPFLHGLRQLPCPTIVPSVAHRIVSSAA